jgi:tRNA1Val (adenine37-N6)-methyltransferase
LIHLADRLPDILTGFTGRAGAITVLPLSPRVGQAARRVIVRARKGSRAPFQLLSPLVIHEGATHLRDADSFTAEISTVLRDGASLQFAFS